MKNGLWVLTIAFVLGVAHGAHADAPGQVAPSAPPPGYQWQLAPVPQPAPEQDWYRTHMMIGDAAAIGVEVFFMAQRNPKLGDMIPGAVAFALVGPAVHLAQGNRRGAVHSLALRVGLPALGALLGAASSQCDNCYDGNPRAAYPLLGTIVGAAAAMVIDDGWLAHKARVERPAWTPVVAPAPRGSGATFGLARSF